MASLPVAGTGISVTPPHSDTPAPTDSPKGCAVPDVASADATSAPRQEQTLPPPVPPGGFSNSDMKERQRVTDADIARALNAADDFHKAWSDFQKRFDAVNKALVENIGQQLKAEAEVDDPTEYNDSDASIGKNAVEIARLIKGSKCCVFLTGAGISTSAGICDYRGPKGKWTMEAKGMSIATRPVDTLLPTPAHMAIQTLIAGGAARHLVSTNIDGLHGYSGVGPADLTEVHGSCFVERCPACSAVYTRPFPVRYTIGKKDKTTAGVCVSDGCEGARLVDTIVNFGDNLDKPRWDRVVDLAENECDLLIVLGSSIRVQPSASLPRAVQARGGKVVIVNRQKTSSDTLAAVRVFGGIDLTMKRVMSHLGHAIPAPPPPRLVMSSREKAAWRQEHGCLFSSEPSVYDSDGESPALAEGNVEKPIVDAMRVAMQAGSEAAEGGQARCRGGGSGNGARSGARVGPAGGGARRKPSVAKAAPKRAKGGASGGAGSQRPRRSSLNLPTLGKASSVGKK